MDLLGIHLIGYTAALVGTLSYFIRAPRKILILHAVSWGIWTIYFDLVGGLSGAVVAAVGVISCTAGAIAGQAWLKRITWLSLVAIWVVGLGFASRPLWEVAVLAPLIASTIEVFSMALRDRPIAFRAAAIASNLCWISFGIAVEAYASVLFGFANLGVVICTIALIAARTHQATKTS
jgi:hypothetical protein